MNDSYERFVFVSCDIVCVPSVPLNAPWLSFHGDANYSVDTQCIVHAGKNHQDRWLILRILIGESGQIMLKMLLHLA